MKQRITRDFPPIILNVFYLHNGFNIMEYVRLSRLKKGARLLHEFNNFKAADRDEVTDYILEYNAIKYGYEAV